MTEAGLETTRGAFNRIASDYDAVLSRNPINAWMHSVNLTELERSFPIGTNLLELGCGTGTAALHLAQNGRRVVGLDISDGMVAQARNKAIAAGLEDRVSFIRGRSADLLALTRGSPWSPFDGAYANFTLGYEASLGRVAEALAAALRPGARVVCTLMNRVVLSELVIYGPLMRFGDVLWRLEVPLQKDVHGVLVEIRAYSPGQVRRAFRPQFILEGMIGIPTFLPPVYLHRQYKRLGGGQRLLQGLDRALAPRFPWNRFGEHTLYRFRLRGREERLAVRARTNE